MSKRTGRALHIARAIALALALALVSPASLTRAGSPASAEVQAGVGPTQPDAAGAALRPVPGLVTAEFVAPAHAYGPGHRGVDLAARPGDPVIAALAGSVAFAGPVAGVGWLTIRHSDRLATTYGDVVPTVAAGESVTGGQVIAHLAAAAGHLDWGARLDGTYIDPLTLLEGWRVRLADIKTLPSGQLLLVTGRGGAPGE